MSAGLPLSERTLADYLAKAGYATGMVGKWHLGMRRDRHPLSRGFGEFFGFLHGAHDYFDPLGAGFDPILEGREPVLELDYLTDAFAREAVAFVERHRKEPFFLYLSFNAVHTPLQADEKRLARFATIEDPKRRRFAGMLAAMDEAVGAVVRKVRDAGLAERTLFIFFGDNGGPTRVTTTRNDPLRGGKGLVYEGGIRVPFVVAWEGKLPRGAIYGHAMSTLDVVPTVLAAAGVEVPEDVELDGVNLLPYLGAETDGEPHERLFWRMGRRKAVRSGPHKLLTSNGERFELYDLDADISESKDLAAEKPELVKALKAALAEWESELVEPLWKASGARARRARRARDR